MNNPFQLHGWVCSSPVYRFDGWTFEFHRYCGPWPLRADGELRKRAGRVFWAMFNRFMNMPEEQQEEFRIGGGCHRF